MNFTIRNSFHSKQLQKKILTTPPRMLSNVNCSKIETRPGDLDGEDGIAS